MSEGESNIQIRTAKPDDAPSIAKMMHQCFVEFESSYSADAFSATVPNPEQILNRMDEGPIWIAIRDASVVATISVVPHGERLYIRGMAALPSVRGARIGESLLKHVEAFGFKHKYRLLTLSTTPFLTSAIRLYERMGFRRTNDGPFDLHGTPLFTMVKEIQILEESGSTSP